MSRLRLFGLHLPVTGDGSVANPDAVRFEGRWRVQVENDSVENDSSVDLDVQIKIDAIATLRVVARLALDRRGEDLVPRDGAPLAARRFQLAGRALSRAPRGGDVQLDFGPVRLATSASSDNALMVVGGELRASFASVGTPLLASETLPLQIHAGAGGFGVDLAQREIELGAGFLTASTFVRALHPDGETPLPLFERTHRSLATSVSLAAAGDRLALPFAATSQDDGKVLALQADLRNREQGLGPENPIVVPITAERYQLILALSRSGRRGPANLAAARLAPPGANRPTTLRLHTLAGPANRPAVVQTDGEIELAVRLGGHDAQRVGTFLIAPALPERGALPMQAQEPEAWHGVVPRVRWEGPAQGISLVCKTSVAHPRVNQRAARLEPALAQDVTLPWLRMTQARIAHPKGGDSYLAKGGGDNAVDVQRFAGAPLGIPLMPDRLLDAVPNAREAHYQTLDRLARQLSTVLEEARHETLLVERPTPETGRIGIERLYERAAAPGGAGEQATAPSGSDARPAAGLATASYEVERDYGVAKVRLTVPGGGLPDYVVFRRGGGGRLEIEGRVDGAIELELDPDFPGLAVGSFPKQSERRPLAILKLSGDRTLREIFQREKLGDRVSGFDETVSFVEDVIDPQTRQRGWVGLILFDLGLSLAGVPMLDDLVPAKARRIRYLALTPRKPGTGPRRVSFNARVMWRNRAAAEEPPQPDQHEATYRFNGLDIVWQDSRLTQFDAAASVFLKSVFGVENSRHDAKQSDTWLTLPLRGRLELEPAPRLRLIGELDNKLAVLDPIYAGLQGFGPIAQIWFGRAEVSHGADGTLLNIDGDMALRKVGLESIGLAGDWFNLPDSAGEIGFRGLALRFPSDGPSSGLRWLRFLYPAVEIDLEKAHYHLFNLPQLRLKIRSFGLDWHNSGDWSGLIDLGEVPERWSRDIRYVQRMDLRLTLGSLPELAAKPFDEFSIDFSLGLGRTADRPHHEPAGLRAALSAVGFEGLHLDIGRFITLDAEGVALRSKLYDGDKRAPWIEFRGVRLKILGHTIIDYLTFVFFNTPDGTKGFLAFLGHPSGFEDDDADDKPPADPPENPPVDPPGTQPARRRGKKKKAPKSRSKLIQIPWILVGQNLVLEDDLPKAIMSIDAPDDEADFENVANAINTAVQDDVIYPRGSGADVGEWLFAAGFSFFDGLVAGKFLFQDRAYYGIALKGAIFKKWFGYDLAISCLYIRRERPEEDSFIVSLRIPAIDAGAIRFMGGVLTVEIAMNGNFALDAGFPWLADDGIRDWSRSFGAIIAPLPVQASGGIYFRFQRTTLPTGDGQLVFGAGYAMQAGVGASFGGGVFRVWVRAGYYMICEGLMLLERSAARDTELAGLRLVGAVGILVEGHGELDWWIISVRVSIVAGAEARATLLWGTDPQNPANVVPGDSAVIQLDFILHAHAEAEACIGAGPFKLCKSIGVSVSMPFRQRLLLG